MNEMILLKLGEVVLKGLNRRTFEDKLLANIRRRLQHCGALKPQVTLGKYKGVEVGKFDVNVTEEEITAEIDRERGKNARTVDVEDRTVQEGDIANIDFEGFVDGVAFDGGKGTEDRKSVV